MSQETKSIPKRESKIVKLYNATRSENLLHFSVQIKVSYEIPNRPFFHCSWWINFVLPSISLFVLTYAEGKPIFVWSCFNDKMIIVWNYIALPNVCRSSFWNLNYTGVFSSTKVIYITVIILYMTLCHYFSSPSESLEWTTGLLVWP